MTDERKATDVLLGIEGDIRTLTQTMSALMLAHTLTLEKTNKIYNYISRLEAEIEQEQKMQQIQTGASALSDNQKIASPEVPLQVETEPVGVRRTSRQPEPDGEVVQQKGERKVPVVQRITDHTGKDLFMADVKVMNEAKEIVAKCKTNSIGKWQAHIIPGKYTVHIIKTDTATKTKIEAMQAITVPNNSATFTLPIAVIKKTT